MNYDGNVVAFDDTTSVIKVKAAPTTTNSTDPRNERTSANPNSRVSTRQRAGRRLSSTRAKLTHFSSFPSQNRARAAPANFEQKFQVQQAKLGDSVRLECLAHGDQPLKIDWFLESNRTALERTGNDFYEIHETPVDSGALLSVLELRALSSRDSQLYKCLASNEFGSSERVIKLIVSTVPERPLGLRVRDVWSRSALVGWSAASAEPAAALGQVPGATSGQPGGRVSNFTVQYWRKTAGPTLAFQNHRRESLAVDGLQTSALLPNLLPALTYEVSVIAQNLVGQSEPSETILVTTSEEEPSAPPTDVQVEAHGAATVRVMWKTPPVESLNGKLLGFYIGYRPRTPMASQLAPQLSGALHATNPLQPVAQSAPIYSFKTADAIEGLAYYETFLTNLKPLSEYEITVRAFNKAGSGPDCHVLVARTGTPRLPGPPTLQVQRVTSSAVSLRWTGPAGGSGSQRAAQLQLGAGLQASAQTPHYELFYQIQGERDWYQLSVAPPSPTIGQPAENELQIARQTSSGHFLAGGQTSDELAAEQSAMSSANLHTLSNLQPGLAYRIYVAATNELGLGDPSNVVVVRTGSSGGDLAGGPAGAVGPAGVNQQDGRLALDSAQFPPPGGTSPSTAASLLEALTQPQHGLVYTLISSAALVAMLLSLAGYFAWQRRLKCKYNSSSASSYPSSWTQAASDTIQSECSIKRLPSSALIAAQPPPPPPPPPPACTSQRPQAHEIYDEVECVVAQHQQQARRGNGKQTGAAGLHQLQLRSSATMARPVLSSHYQQPGGTLQFAAAGQARSSAAGAAAATAAHFKTSATLNRHHQNRQLPPIPYGTMGVKEPQRQRPGASSSSQQQVAGGQQQKQRAHQNYGPATSFAGSQTPLIYGVVE